MDDVVDNLLSLLLTAGKRIRDGAQLEFLAGSIICVLCGMFFCTRLLLENVALRINIRLLRIGDENIALVI